MCEIISGVFLFASREKKAPAEGSFVWTGKVRILIRPEPPEEVCLSCMISRCGSQEGTETGKEHKKSERKS